LRTSIVVNNLPQAAEQLRLSRPTYRPDVDGLRAVAVLFVVAFHMFPYWAPGGFIGVDIFFVISGYLISTLILQNLERGTFSFAEFYARRVRRIFPALILVLFATYAFGWFVLLADEYQQLGKHIAAGSGFVSNLVLWSEAGYFDNSSDTKPLLHLWSLGIEEQFYIAFPLLMWVIWKARVNLLAVIASLAAVSLYLNIDKTASDATAAFYSLHTRFWELLCGTLLAWVALHTDVIPVGRRQRALANAGSLVGVSLLAYGLVNITREAHFPGAWAAIPVAGAALIIAASPSAWVNRAVLSNPVAVGVGLLSYPLYLWHWPLLSFARIIEGDVPRASVRVTAIVVSFVLSAATYKLVEAPIRRPGSGASRVALLATAMAIVGSVGYHAYSANGLAFRSVVERHSVFMAGLVWRYWDNPECTARFGMSPCQYSGESLKVLILGDSHGNQLYPGLVKYVNREHGIIAAGTCPPVLGLTVYVEKNQAAHPCATVDYLSLNLRILDANPGIDTVVLASFWRPVLDGRILSARGRDYFGSIRVASTVPQERALAQDELVYRGLARTIRELTRRGKQVIFVRDAPDMELDIRDTCLERLSFFSEMASDCRLPRSMFDERREKESVLVGKLTAAFPALEVVDPFPVLCRADYCSLTRDGRPLYRDEHHLSEYGSEVLARMLVNEHLKGLRPPAEGEE
jgi:peptidoglycan/LPS O-acetylase OafA/YrhL